MALRLRRGTEAERQALVTPLAEGELIYVTDTGKLFIGDGVETGGVEVVGGGGGGGGATTLNQLTDTDLLGYADGDVLTYVGASNKWEPIPIPGASPIGMNDLTDVQIAGDLNALDILLFDGFNFIPVSVNSIFQEQQNYRINVIGDDSTILVDGDRGEFNGTLNGNVNGTLIGNAQNIGGDVLIDATNSTLSNTDLFLDGNSIKPLVSDHVSIDTTLTIQKGYGVSNNPDLATQFVIESYRGTDVSPLAVQSGDYISAIAFSAYDGSIVKPKVQLTTEIDTVTGLNALPGKLLINTHDYDGGYNIAASFDSRGTFEAPTLKVTPYANATDRDAAIPSPEAGMIVYLTDTNKHQGYNGTTWNDFY